MSSSTKHTLASGYFKPRIQVLTSDRIIESLLRKMASLIGGVQNLVVEDGKVQGKTKTDGMRGGQLSLGDFGSSLVCLKRLVGRLLSSIANGELGEVAVVVTLPDVVISRMSSCDIKKKIEQAYILW